MAIKLDNGKYQCSFCHKVYDKPSLADSCRDNHDLVYPQILASDVNRLLQIILLTDNELVTETMIRSLRESISKKKT